jgi:uncharacterized lipoprotein
MRIVVFLIVALAAASVTGCNGMRKVANVALPGQPFEPKQKVVCKQSNKDYVGAQELPPLKAPEGLEAPNTRNALKVPPLATPERVRGPDEPCLDAPPPYSTAKTAPAAPAPPPPPNKPREVPTE